MAQMKSAYDGQAGVPSRRNKNPVLRPAARSKAALERRVRRGATMSSRLLAPLVTYLQQHDACTPELLRRAGLNLAELEQPASRVSHDAAICLWESAVAQLHDPRLGLHVAQHVEPGSMDLIEYWSSHCNQCRSSDRSCCRNNNNNIY